MLRTDRDIIVQALKTAKGTLGQLKRGYITFDSADAVSYKADGQLLDVVMGLKVNRLASLSNGKYAYYDEAGNSLATNV
jgi:hypothetical protein